MFSTPDHGWEDGRAAHAPLGAGRPKRRAVRALRPVRSPAAPHGRSGRLLVRPAAGGRPLPPLDRPARRAPGTDVAAAVRPVLPEPVRPAGVPGRAREPRPALVPAAQRRRESAAPDHAP